MTETITKSKSFRNQYTIRQGRISLYQRTAQGTGYQSDNWYARFKIPNQKAIRKSLKTDDKYEAESIAESIYFDLTEKSKRGLSLSSKKFSQVANAFIRDYALKVKRESALKPYEKTYKPQLFENKQRIVNNYLMKYFKDKNLTDITDFDIESYKHWRATYWVSGEGSKLEYVEYIRDGRKVRRPKQASEKREPNYDTVNKEMTVLRGVFEFARLKRMIEGRQVPSIKNNRRPKNLIDRKSGFTEDEVTKLLTTTANRYYNLCNPKHKRHLKLVLHYMAFLCLTGLRVSEAKNLKISDCEIITKDNKRYLKIFVRAKGKSREAIGLEESETVLEKLKLYHKENALERGWNYHNDLPLFTDQYGNKVGSFAKGINRAFDDAGLLHDKHGIKRSAGAFRKYYITMALLYGVDYFQLAKQCGTSVTVIEHYYSEIEVFHRPELFIFNNALTGVYD